MAANAAHRSRPVRRHENGTPYGARIAMLAGVAAPAGFLYTWIGQRKSAAGLRVMVTSPRLWAVRTA